MVNNFRTFKGLSVFLVFSGEPSPELRPSTTTTPTPLTLTAATNSSTQEETPFPVPFVSSSTVSVDPPSPSLLLQRGASSSGELKRTTTKTPPFPCSVSPINHQLKRHSNLRWNPEWTPDLGNKRSSLGWEQPAATAMIKVVLSIPITLYFIVLGIFWCLFPYYFGKSCWNFLDFGGIITSSVLSFILLLLLLLCCFLIIRMFWYLLWIFPATLLHC